MTKTERRIKKDMESLGTWRPQCAETVRLCADMEDQYWSMRTKQAEENLPCYEMTDSGATRKTAFTLTLESLRKDILAYQKELGLTPMAVKRIDAQQDLPQSSILADALRGLARE